MDPMQREAAGNKRRCPCYSKIQWVHGNVRNMDKTGHLENDNDWFGDCIGGKVIAWMPLPEPYREG